ncbi:hypothetical protein CPB83DRAFT_838168 [Crepidotus variabilis]|uniref:Uncharacterized protein n=1 Tax=Crepidotus variabilis TaxID=179855 RepID=A0A9P6EAJ4_9AGAR|nr:hypothetical protein CPB83DRAFT_838168 [Crepidotus variabilis]
MDVLRISPLKFDALKTVYKYAIAINFEVAGLGFQKPLRFEYDPNPLTTAPDFAISSGLGRHLAQEALRRGDKVVGTDHARPVAKLADLKTDGADTLELDVIWPLGELQETAKAAPSIHGRIDVVVNDAGMRKLSSSSTNGPFEPWDPLKGVSVLVDLVKGENGAADKIFPPLVALGNDCYSAYKDFSGGYLKLLKGWEVSISTDISSKN